MPETTATEARRLVDGVVVGNGDEPAGVGARGVHAADLIAIGALTATCAVLVAALARGVPVGGESAVHGGMLAGWLAFSLLASRAAGSAWVPPARAVAVVATMFTLYGTLARVPFVAVPWLADPALAAADRLLFAGRSPALLIDALLSPGRVEVLSFFYAAFIPYLYLSIFLGLVGRPPRERDEFITGFALLYGASFLGYLLVPARGPIVELAPAFGADLVGGRFHGLVTAAIADMGGPHGAFPSLHVGASVYACAFDFRRGDPLRGLIYVPLVGMIVLATVALRYHYVVDLVAGVALALAAGVAAARLFGRPAAVDARPGAGAGPGEPAGPGPPAVSADRGGRTDAVDPVQWAERGP